MLEAVGFPVAVNPEAKLAAIARKRGWHVEHWSKAAGGAPPACCPIGPLLPAPSNGAAAVDDRGRCGREGARLRAVAAPLRGGPGGRRSAPGGGGRVGPAAAGRRRPARAARARTGSGSGPACPASAGRDLATVDGRSSSRTSSRSSASRSCPATRWSATHRRTARRVVVEPVLGCAARGIDPPCPACAGRATPAAASTSPSATSSPGLQTGFCADTGGGWSTAPWSPTPASSTPCPRR